MDKPSVFSIIRMSLGICQQKNNDYSSVLFGFVNLHRTICGICTTKIDKSFISFYESKIRNSIGKISGELLKIACYNESQKNTEKREVNILCGPAKA